MAYATRADIEAVFGKSNVEQWADLDNDEVHVDIAARINTALADAIEFVDDTLRAGPYTLPLTSTHATIKRLTAILAGVRLYEARGVQDVNEVTGQPLHKYVWHKQDADKTLKRILAGQLRLAGETDEASIVPAVVTEDDDDDEYT